MSGPRSKPSLVAAAAALIATGVLVAASIAPAGAAPARSAPSIELAPDTLTLGSWTTVTGDGFQPGELVLVEVCGSHVSSSLGCDDRTAVNAEVTGDGSLDAPLLVDRPPAPCPCVVRVRGSAAGDEASAPLTVTDMDSTDEPVGQESGHRSVSGPEVAVSEVELTGASTWPTWFGASPTRTFRYTLQNRGDTLADGLAVVLRSGPKGSAHQLLRAPPVEGLDPGESRSYAVSVDLGPFAHGDFEVRAALVGPDGRRPFGAQTSSFPWMVLVIPAVIIFEVLLLIGRNQLRDHVQRGSDAAVVSPVVAAAVVGRLERVREVGVDTRSLAGRVVAGLRLPAPPSPPSSAPEFVEPTGGE